MSERASGRRRAKDDAPTRFTLGPLLEAQVFTAGPGRLTCGVGGRDYSADLGEGGEIFFEGHTFKSPSAFSVYVKRKVNPSRKADDGWTSVKYNGELLSVYRPKLEELISLGIGGSRTPLGPSLSAPSPRASPLRSSQPRRKRRKRDEFPETSEEWDDVAGLESDDEYRSTHRAAASRDSRGAARSRPSQAGRAVRDYISNEQQLAEMEAEQQLPAAAAAAAALEAGEGDAHMQACQRPPLSVCTPQEFEEDLYAFLTARRETELVKHLRNKRITCNNTPLDIFGLYREVVRHGGFVANERYDDYSRWTGGINFAGQIFPKMANFTPANRATSIGNQLLSNYRKFLLAYEIAHRGRDLEAPEPSTTQAASGLEFLANIASGEASGGGEIGTLDAGKVPRGHRSSRPRTKREPAEDDEPESALKQPGGGGKQPGGGGGKQPEASKAGGRRVLAALRRAEAHAGRHPPGSLLLAQDPADLNRHWPVLVAASGDLPRAVASGGTTADAATDGFPLPLREAAPSGRPEDAYPVCVFGTQVLGWVEAAACRHFNLSAGESAAAFVRPDGGRRTGAAAQACGRALKLAAQYCACADPLQTAARAMTAAAGCAHAAGRLLGLEGRLPPQGALCSSNFHFWQQWRRAAAGVQTPAELTPLVLTLAHQIVPEMLTRAGADTLWEDLRFLLDMEPPAAGAAPGLPSAGVSVLAADDAVTTLDEALDWPRVLRTQQLGAPAGSGLRVASPARAPAAASPHPKAEPGGGELRNCASNTDLAAHFRQAGGGGAAAQPGRSGTGAAASPLRPAAEDADRASGLQKGGGALPAQPREAAQVDSTGSAEGQGSLAGRQPSPDHASAPPQPQPQPQPPLQQPQGFQAYVPPAAAVGKQL